MSWGHRGGRSDWEKGGSGHFGGEEQWPNRERGNRRHSDRYDNQGHHGQGGHDRKMIQNHSFRKIKVENTLLNRGKGGSMTSTSVAAEGTVGTMIVAPVDIGIMADVVVVGETATEKYLAKARHFYCLFQRDRSRSPPRYNRNDDSKWPSMEERESNISNQRHQRYDNHHHQHYDQPKTTLQITGVPQSVTAEMIKATLEMKQVFVRSCQLASTREPGNCHFLFSLGDHFPNFHNLLFICSFWCKTLVRYFYPRVYGVEKSHENTLWGSIFSC